MNNPRLQNILMRDYCIKFMLNQQHEKTVTKPGKHKINGQSSLGREHQLFEIMK